MRIRRKFRIGLIGVAALTLAGGCSEDQATNPRVYGDPFEPPEPPHTSAPASPTDVSVTVQANGVWVSWTPGARTSTQTVVLSNVDGLEPDRIKELARRSAHQVPFTDLQWGASYRVVVTAVNEVGRAESDPASFETPIPDAPVLTWFSASRDPTCLSVEWTASEPATGYRVEVTGAAEAASFEETVPPLTDALFCATSYPIVDGMTYAARVVAVFDGLELESNARQFTVDFDPEYSLTGVWHGAHCFVDLSCTEYSLDLVDVEGDISGWWTWSSDSPVAVTGSRFGGEFELAFDRPWYVDHLSGYLAGPDRIEGIYVPMQMRLLSLERD